MSSKKGREGGGRKKQRKRGGKDLYLHGKHEELKEGETISIIQRCRGGRQGRRGRTFKGGGNGKQGGNERRTKVWPVKTKRGGAGFFNPPNNAVEF